MPAIQFDGTAGEFISLPVGVGAPPWTDHCAIFWFRIDVDRNAVTVLYVQEQLTPYDYLGMSLDANGTSALIWSGPGSTLFGFDVVVGNWYCGVFRQNGFGAGVTRGFIYDLAARRWYTVNSAGNNSAGTNYIRFGDNQFSEPLNGRIGPIKFFDGSITDAEICKEIQYVVPVARDKLLNWYPMVGTTLADMLLDRSAAGLNFTATGTLAVAEGPPIPWGPAPLLTLPGVNDITSSSARPRVTLNHLP